jgi:digeranylgeranylglycerophospholipid reductase
MRYDAIVVGAGPAGLVAAEELALHGFRVAVLEKDQFPGKLKSCGGFLTVKGMREGRIPQSLGERTTTGITLHMPHQPASSVDYPNPVGIQLTRDALGAFLCERAEKANAEIHRSHRVIACRRSAYLWRVEVKGQNPTFEGTLLIGADGVSSTVARSGGFRVRFARDQLGVTAQAQIAMSPDTIDRRFGERMELYYGRDVVPYGYAWIFPKRSCVYVGVGSLLSTVSAGALESCLTTFIHRHRIARTKLAGGRIRFVERALVPLTYQRGSYGDGILLAGDAAGHCSAITGEGIHYALSAGRIAGRVGADALRRNDVTARQLRSYEGRWRREFGGDLKWGLRLRNLLYSGVSAQSVSTGIAADARFLKLAADLIVGLRPYRDTIIRALPFYVWRRITRRAKPS